MNRYAQTLVDAAEILENARKEAVLQNLVTHLRRTGREKLLPIIARDLRRAYAMREKRRGVIEVASASESPSAVRALERSDMSSGEVQINPNLIHGFRARVAGKLLDRSAKAALLDIYRKIIR